jgi:hypothetical protein
MTACIRIVAVAIVIVASAARATSGPTLDVDVQRYLHAPDSARVDVRAYEEGRRPSAGDVPVKDATVILVPRSAALLARLTALKDHARDSLNNYRDAAVAMRRAREDYERTLWDAGAVTLVMASSVDAAGHVRFDDVPAGEWIVFGWRSVTVTTHAEKPGGRADLFRLEPGIEGYRAVSVWMRELTVAPAARESVELTDRNLWFSGVEEIKKKGAGR